MSRREGDAIYELEITEGLEDLAQVEVQQQLGAGLYDLTAGKGWLRFSTQARPSVVTRLRLAEFSLCGAYV